MNEYCSAVLYLPVSLENEKGACVLSWARAQFQKSPSY